MHPIDYYSSYTKNCTGKFTEKEIKDIRAFYYAMCAETDAMLGKWYNSKAITWGKSKIFFQQTVIMLVGDLYEHPQKIYCNSCWDTSDLEF